MEKTEKRVEDIITNSNNENEMERKKAEEHHTPSIACYTQIHTQIRVFASFSIWFVFERVAFFVQTRSIEIVQFIFEDKVQIQSIERLCQ